ncbi:unnamed protein product, partial [Calypogeia fissa]
FFSNTGRSFIKSKSQPNRSASCLLSDGFRMVKLEGISTKLFTENLFFEVLTRAIYLCQ